jgi:hypothetical protein
MERDRKYTVTRACCTHGHCSLCAGGGDKRNRETIVVCTTSDLSEAEDQVSIWASYDASITDGI